MKYSTVRNLIDRSAHTFFHDLCRHAGFTRPRIEDGSRYIVDKIQEKDVLGIADPTQILLGYLPEGEIEWEVPDLNLYRFDRAVLTGKAGFVYNSDGTRLFDCSLPFQPSQKIRRPIRFLGHEFGGDGTRYFHLRGESLHNRAHFMVEHAPRLFAQIQRNSEIDENYRVLLVNGYPSWYSDYLKLFGIDESRFVEGSLGTDTVRNLDYIPNPGGRLVTFSGKIYSEMCSFLHRRVLGLTGESTGPAKTLWITRSDAGNRRLTNIPELAAVWSENFGEANLLTLSDMSFIEQLRRINSSPCIITEMGQALNLLPFMRGRVVIMLDSGGPHYVQTWNSAYFTLAVLSGNFMIRLYSGEPTTLNADWRYPAEKFERELKNLRELSSADRLDPIWYEAGFHRE